MSVTEGTDLRRMLFCSFPILILIFNHFFFYQGMGLNSNGQIHNTPDLLCRSAAVFCEVWWCKFKSRIRYQPFCSLFPGNKTDVCHPCVSRCTGTGESCAFCLCHEAPHCPTWPHRVPPPRLMPPVLAAGSWVSASCPGKQEQDFSLREGSQGAKQTAEAAWKQTETWQWHFPLVTLPALTCASEVSLLCGLSREKREEEDITKANGF